MLCISTYNSLTNASVLRWVLKYPRTITARIPCKASGKCAILPSRMLSKHKSLMCGTYSASKYSASVLMDNTPMNAITYTPQSWPLQRQSTSSAHTRLHIVHNKFGFNGWVCDLSCYGHILVCFRKGGWVRVRNVVLWELGFNYRDLIWVALTRLRG